MAQIEILSERETGGMTPGEGGGLGAGAGGWLFDMQALDDAGGLHRFRLRLSWADYNLWSPDGTAAPSRLAEAVLAFLLSRKEASELPASFDASIARRWFADADEVVPGMGAG